MLSKPVGVNDSSSTPLSSLGTRKRTPVVRFTTALPSMTLTAATAAAPQRTKISTDERRELAIIYIAKKCTMSLSVLETKAGMPGHCNGERIRFHVKQMTKMRTQLNASAWDAQVDVAWSKWEQVLTQKEQDTDVVMATEDDLKLGPSARKRKATEAVIADMNNNESLGLKEATANAAIRFQTTLSTKTVKRFKANPKRKTHGAQMEMTPFMERDLAYTITFCRRYELQMTRTDCKDIANRMLAKIPIERRPFGERGVSNKWFVGFMKRNKLKPLNQDPNDSRRAFWLTSENMFKCFLSLSEVAVAIGVATKNPKFDTPETTPTEMPISWIPSEMWRVIEFDECGCDIGIKQKEKPKSQREKVICPEGDTGTTLRDGVPAHHVSLMVANNLACDNLRPGICFDAGNDVCLGKFTTNDKGKPLTVPVRSKEGTLEEKEAIFFSNECGSFDAEILMAYISQVIDDLPHALSAERKALLFIDGCQTHICRAFIEHCEKLHIEVVIKVPYASSKMQSMDAQGGHFVRFKISYRIALNKRVTSKSLAFRRSNSRTKRVAGTLNTTDFIPCAEAAIKAICQPEIHRIAFETIGLSPFTMRPAYERLEEEKKKQALKDDLATVDVDNESASQGLMEFMPEFFGLADAQQPEEDPAAVLARSSALDAVDAAAEAKERSGGTLTDAEAGSIAARKVIHISTLSSQDKNKLKAIGRAQNWAIQKSGGVFQNFKSHATGLLHRTYQNAIKAKTNAIANNKKRRNVTRAAKAAQQQVDQTNLCATTLPKAIACRWESSSMANANDFTVAQLLALANVDGKLNLKKMKKATLLGKMEPYFLGKRSLLPKQHRTNQGSAPSQLNL